MGKMIGIKVGKVPKSNFPHGWKLPPCHGIFIIKRVDSILSVSQGLIPIVIRFLRMQTMKAKEKIFVFSNLRKCALIEVRA